MKELINFKNQNLNLDYLTLNIPNSVGRILEFAEIFFRYGFNSKVYYVETGTTEQILQDESFKYYLTFRVGKESWDKNTLLIQFSGINSGFLYYLLKNEFFSFSELNCQNLTVGRIDINFIRKNKIDDSNLIAFFQQSKKTFENKYKNGNARIQLNPEDNRRSLLLGSRGSNFAARIYQEDSALKFELEIKKEKAKDLGLFLLRNSFLEFEGRVSKDYFSYFFRSIYLETCFTDWLTHFFRLRSLKSKKHLIASDIKKYFLTQTSEEKIKFYRLLQFLSFVRSYQGKEIDVIGQTYISVEFKLVDFMKAVNSTRNTYQRKEFLEFFDDLQGLPPFREKFAKRNFRKLLFFPVVNTIQETKRGPWIIQVAIAEQLLLNSYTFHFPPSFFYHSNEHNLRVKFSIILSLAQESSIKKRYPIQSFLNEFENRSNSIQAQVKREIIQEFQNLLKFNIIEPRFIFEFENNQEIIRKDEDNIQLKDIHSSKYIYFYETIQNH